MDLKASFQRAVQADDGFGSWDATWSSWLEDVDCSIQPISDEWRREYMKLGRDTSHVLYCNELQGSLSISKECRKQTNRVVFDGRYFEVVHAKDVAENMRMAHLILMERDEGWKAVA